MNQLMKMLDEYLVKKAPALPKNIKDVLVKFAPWVSIITLVLALPAVLAVLGMGGLVSGMMWATNYGYGGGYWLATVVLIVSLVLQGLAIPGLFARTKNGWDMSFYATLVGAVHNLVTGSWVSLIVGTLLSWYFLFQIRSYYK